MTQTTPPLGGRYELRRQLAAGPAARVYLAQDLELGRPVAVKVLGPDLARDPQVVERFRQAANTAASVHDPRIVTIYDWGDDQGAVYVAMELVDGSSLAETLRDAHRLGVDRTVAIGVDVADALDAAHRAGIVHGSLTPSDVLLARDGTVKVTDFGTATAGLSSLGDPIVAATYQAPEQLQGQPPDVRSDLYALGTILYVAACGSPPFSGPDVVAITQRKLTERVVPPSASTPGIPPVFDAVVERLLERDPAGRYPSGAAAAADLRRLGETIQVPLTTATTQLPTVAAPGPVPTPAPVGGDDEPKRRSATGWIVAAIILLVLAVGGLVAWAVSQDDETATQEATVPPVVGLPLPQAQAEITRAELDATTVNEANEDFGEGIVFSQAPQPTTTVRKGSVVVLKVSTGPTPTTTTTPETTTTTTPETTTTTTPETTTTTVPETTTTTGP